MHLFMVSHFNHRIERQGLSISTRRPCMHAVRNLLKYLYFYADGYIMCIVAAIVDVNTSTCARLRFGRDLTGVRKGAYVVPGT